jgi:hypothetical protein
VREALRAGKADTLGGSGDDGDLIFEAHGVFGAHGPTLPFDLLAAERKGGRLQGRLFP